MRRSKRIYLLLGILVAACVATFGVVQMEEHQEKIKNSDKIILEIAGESVQSLSWEYEGEKLSFHREETWRYDEDEAFPVDEEKINELLEQFQEFGVSFIIEEVEDYGQYGLDDPICTIQLTTQDQSYEILLGNYSDMDAERYVSIGDGNVYLVKNDPLDAFDAVLSDLLDHDDIPVFEKASEIQFTGAESYSIVYEENSANTYRTEDVYFFQKDGEELPLDTARVKGYLNNISGLNLASYVTYNVTEEELQTYGLDNPELVVTVDYPTENESGETLSSTFVLQISRAAEEKETKGEESGTAEETEEEEVTAYARVGESQIVYQISSEDYKDLMETSYDDFRHLEVLPAEFIEISQIDISLEGMDYTITSEKKGDERVYDYQGDELEIDELQNALEALGADRFTDEQPTQKEEIRLTLRLEREDNPEIEIVLYRYDGTHCLAVVDGAPVSLVERSCVVDLVEAVHAIVLN